MRILYSKSPEITLPKASRFSGLVISGLFSLIEITGFDRGCCIETKKTIRKL